MKEWNVSEIKTNYKPIIPDNILSGLSSEINRLDPAEVFLTVSDALRKHPDMKNSIITSVENYAHHAING